jgi:uncharacterized membrane protein required for colicin V production
MDALDVILIIVVLGAAVHGLRLGAAVQVLSFAGGFLGIVLGIVLVVVVTPHVHGVFVRTFVALLLLFVPFTIMWGVGRQLGSKIWRRLRGHRIAAVDAGSGAVIAMGSTLVLI